LKPFEDYKTEVLLAYQKKKDEGLLPNNLVHHTPANIKRECINEFPARFSEKDTETFKSLVGPANSPDEYYKKIRDADPDIFRPLNNFLRGQTDNTNDRNIYLLAWLINFEPEPEEPLEVTTVIPPLEPPSDIFSKTISWIRDEFKRKQTIYTIILIMLCAIIIWYGILKPRHMYWSGNEYKPLAFYQETEGLMVVKLDTFRLRHLKKITNLKLIKRTDIGKVHYSSIKREYQFYTTGGENPEDTTKRLLPMSELIYEKYVLKKQTLK